MTGRRGKTKISLSLKYNGRENNYGKLFSLGKTEFCEAQQQDKNLKWVQKRVEMKRIPFEMRNGLVFHITAEFRRTQCKQLVVSS